MNHSHVANILDFGKHGLLRFLLTNAKGKLRLGVNWMLTEEMNVTPQQATRFKYLDDEKIVGCDRKLSQGFTKIRDTEPDVSKIKEYGILPDDTIFFEDPIPIKDKTARKIYMKKASEELSAADLIFCDPERGISESFTGQSKDHAKLISPDEIKFFWDKNKSLLIYQHFPRQKEAEATLENRYRKLKEHLSCKDIWIFRFCKSHKCDFILIPQPHHLEILNPIIESFKDSPWVRGGFFKEPFPHNGDFSPN